MAEKTAEKVFLLMSGASCFFNLLMQQFMEEDEEDIIVQYLCGGRKRRRRINDVKPTNFAEKCVPSMNDTLFRSQFHLKRTNFELLVSTVGPFISRDENLSGRKTTDVHKQVLIFLCLLTTTDSYNSIGERFGVSKAVVYSCYWRVVKALNLENVRKQFIVWPTGVEAQKVMDEFQKKAGFPSVIGAIDSCYICIKPPNPPGPFYTRKKFPAVSLLACCDPNLKFTYCIAGFPGSYQDSRILKESDLPGNSVQMFQDDAHLVGVSAFPINTWLLVPYKDDGTLTPSQENYNLCHAETRRVIGNAFRLLKNRFCRFKDRLTLNCEAMYGPTIIAGCVVHNIALIDDPDVTTFLDEDDDETEYGNAQDNFPTSGEKPGFLKRDDVCNRLMQIG